MDYVQYYITTFTNAFKTMAPIIAFIVGGYLIFFKFPFWFLKKNMQEQKQKLADSIKLHENEEKYTVENYKNFQKLIKGIGQTESQSKNKDQHQSAHKSNSQGTHRKQGNFENERHGKSQSKQKTEPKTKIDKTLTPEELFHLKPNESFSQVELKKKYLELIKQNHPDRVASMGQDFKKLAEKNTKEINEAYEKLKKKAS